MTKTRKKLQVCVRTVLEDLIGYAECAPADGFISTFDDVDEDISRRDHARLDRHLDTVEDKSPEQIARDLSKRYGGRAVRYTGDMNEIPQRLLMPSVHDASLWQVRVKVCNLFNR
jgi:transcription elongation factor SPT5